MRISIHLCFISIVFLLCISLVRCKKDSLSTDPSFSLEFSRDTVLFDTVFTTIGSTTQTLKIYNNNNEDLEIDQISLLGGTGSQFRMNVDGVPGFEFENIRVDAGDSLWVFVEVTVDPGNVNNPFIIEDDILFNTNGNDQLVNLAAWGQDAHFHGGTSLFNVICDEVWNNDKPHVLYGITTVPEGCNLEINAGTQVYCHKGAGILVWEGSLNVNGQLGNEVVFQGDRLETSFDDIPGQWGIELQTDFLGQNGVETFTSTFGGIWLLFAQPSEIDFAIVKNANIGIQIDSTYTAGSDALRLTNTKIQNMSAIGLYGRRNAEIFGFNNLVANCGQTCGAFTLGGKYRFQHCTFANYSIEGNRQTPTLFINNYFESAPGVFDIRSVTDTEFLNCIIWGNNSNLSDFSEFFVDLMEEESQIYVMDHCVLDTELDISDTDHYIDIQSATPPFVSVDDLNFILSTPSSTFNGAPLIGQDAGLQFDLKGSIRSLGSNIVGCYEPE